MTDALERARVLMARVAAPLGELRLVGGLATRIHLGSWARTTFDVDLVAMNDQVRERVLQCLRAEGYEVGLSGGWWRASRLRAGEQELVDLAPHPVVNPKTFDTVELRAMPFVADAEPTLPAAGIDDLALLKLCAGRDQDLVDLALIAAHARLDTKSIGKSTRLDDVERQVASTVLEAKFSLDRGFLDDSFGELLGRDITFDEKQHFAAFLQALESELG